MVPVSRISADRVVRSFLTVRSISFSNSSSRVMCIVVIGVTPIEHIPAKAAITAAAVLLIIRINSGGIAPCEFSGPGNHSAFGVPLKDMKLILLLATVLRWRSKRKRGPERETPACGNQGCDEFARMNASHFPFDT